MNHGTDRTKNRREYDYRRPYNGRVFGELQQAVLDGDKTLAQAVLEFQVSIALHAMSKYEGVKGQKRLAAELLNLATSTFQMLTARIENDERLG